MSFWGAALAILRKDLAMEMRGKETFTTVSFFALLTVVIFSFAFDMTSINIKDSSAGILWVAFIFSGALSMNQSFLKEKENDCLSALRLAPIDRTSIFFGKTLGGLVIMLLAQVIIIPVFMILFNINVMEHFFWQTAVFFLGTVGFVTVGSLIAAMSVNLRAREMLGPLLTLPVVAPVVISAVEASGGLIRGADVETLYIWMEILVAFDVIYLVVSWLVFDKLIEE